MIACCCVVFAALFVVICFISVQANKLKAHKQFKNKHHYTPIFKHLLVPHLVNHKALGIYKLCSGRGFCKLDKKPLVPHFQIRRYQSLSLINPTFKEGDTKASYTRESGIKSKCLIDRENIFCLKGL